jgi:hypothetical protein
MAEAARREDRRRTVAEFEAWHARQPERWEFIAGWPRMMAPGSMNHSLIKADLFRRVAGGARRHTLPSARRRPADPDRRDLGDP